MQKNETREELCERIRDLTKLFFTAVIDFAAKSPIVEPEDFEMILPEVGPDSWKLQGSIRLIRSRSTVPEINIREDVVQVSEWRSRSTGQLRATLHDYHERDLVIRPKTWDAKRIAKYAERFVGRAEKQVVRMKREAERRDIATQAKETVDRVTKTSAYSYYAKLEDSSNLHIDSGPNGITVKIERTFTPDQFEAFETFFNSLSIRGEM